MKIVIPNHKPRAKAVNDILVSKRCVKHEQEIRPSRDKQKRQFERELKQY